MRIRSAVRIFVSSAVLCVLSGCVLGPTSLLHSRTNYNRAVQKTAREEMLLNLVRMRYDQSVEFMRVPSITGQYTYDATVGADGTWREKVPAVLGLGFGVGAQSRPTIVYTPEQEQEFNRRLLSPISGETLDLLGSKGWAIDRVMRLTVRNINDVDNATSAGGPTPKYKPEFEEFQHVSFLLRQLQIHGSSFEVAYRQKVTKPPLLLSDPIPLQQVDGEDLILAAKEGYRFHVSEDQTQATLWRNEIEEQIQVLHFSEEVRGSPEHLTICEMLELDPSLEFYRIRTDTEGQLKRPHSRRVGRDLGLREEIVLSTRSLKEAMYYLSHVVEVPDSHLEKGYVQPTFDEAGCLFDWRDMMGDLFQVHYSRICPRHAAVAVKYRGLWFYIDDRDISSKSTFNLLLELFNLEIRAGGGAQIPLLTI